MALIADHSTGESAYVSKQAAALLQEALDGLTTRERIVILLRATLPARWVADHMDLSHTMVLKIERQALGKMRQHFLVKGIDSVRHIF